MELCVNNDIHIMGCCISQPKPFPETMVGAGEGGKMLLEHFVIMNSDFVLAQLSAFMAHNAMKAIKTNNCLARPHTTI